MSFGKRSSPDASVIASGHIALSFGRPMKWTMMACLAAGTAYVAYAALGPKPFPADGTVFEQCAYAARAIGSKSTMQGCTLSKYATQIVDGYHLWEKYAAVDPEFPWLGDAELRCLYANGHASMITFKIIGGTFASSDACDFEEDQKTIVEGYFSLKQSMAHR